MAPKIDPGLSQDVRRLMDNIGTVIVGKDEVVSLVVSALLSGGHVLLEDMPGLGKTMLARALSRSIDCDFKRIQCTPDLLPVDITGYVDPRTGEFKRGPIFANIVLADELNRSTPRTQSALLEAMAERQVTVDGRSHDLEAPFMVLATQNPVEHRGVNPLPEAQLDRFNLLISVGYPSRDEERRIMTERALVDPITSLKPVLNRSRVIELAQAASAVRLDPKLVEYILDIVRATRESKDLVLGASPRSAIQLMHLVKAYAFVQDRTFVIPDDIKILAVHSLSHRVLPKEMELTEGVTEIKKRVLRSVIAGVKVP